MEAILRYNLAQERVRADKYRAALELIAAPMRRDGTWNRDRLACQKLAKEALEKNPNDIT